MGIEKQDPEIEDVGASTWTFARTRYRGWLFGLLASTVVYEAWVVYWVASSGMYNNIWLALLPIGVFAAFYAFVRGKVQSEFMEQFARAEGYSYAKDGPLEGRDEFIFSIGHSRAASNFLSGQDHDLPLNLFNYRYTVGQGKEAHTYEFTVYEIEFPNVLLAMTLLEKWRNFGDALFTPFTGKNTLSLEGDFGKYFTLKVAKGLEVEALQIFTPDLMIKLRDQWKNFSLEFVNRHLYIYEDKTIGKRADLLAMRDFAVYLIDRLKNSTARMADDVEDMKKLSQTRTY